MSSDIRTLPPIRPYPERADKEDRWTDAIEAAVRVVPEAIGRMLARRGNLRFVAAVNALETGLADATEAEIEQESVELRVALRRSGFDDALVARSFALVREVSRRELGLRHHDVQIRGGKALLGGSVVEMMNMAFSHVQMP